jgi:hypothetical protein
MSPREAYRHAVLAHRKTEGFVVEARIVLRVLQTSKRLNSIARD